MANKEREFPPKKAPKGILSEERVEEVIREAMTEFREKDIPKLRKDYPKADGDTLKLVINE